jgi:cysteine desulfurase
MLFPVLAQSLTGFTFSTFNAVIYTVCFLVPGFLMDVTVSRFSDKKSEQVPLILLRFLTFTSLNYAIWIFIFLLPWDKSLLTNPAALAIIFFVVILISPLFLGWALGLGLVLVLVFKNQSILPSVWNYPLTGFVYGYQAKIDKPLGKPPTGGSAVKPPPISEPKLKN